jgi:hypothetical protein
MEGRKKKMTKTQKISQNRQGRTWTQATASAYIGRVNRGEQMFGLTYWSAIDFMGNHGHLPKMKTVDDVNKFYQKTK